MAEQKYGKNIITRPRQKELDEWKEFGDVRKSHIYVDEEIVKGGYYLQGSWLYRASGPHCHGPRKRASSRAVRPGLSVATSSKVTLLLRS